MEVSSTRSPETYKYQHSKFCMHNLDDMTIQDNTKSANFIDQEIIKLDSILETTSNCSNSSSLNLTSTA